MRNLNDELPSQGGSQEPPPNSDYYRVGEIPEGPSTGLKIALVSAVVVVGIAALYGWQQHSKTQQLAAERAELRTSLDQAKTQEQALVSKVDALSAAQAQEQQELAQARANAARTVEASGTGQPAHSASARSRTSRRRAAADDPRWKQIQTQLGDQQKQIAADQKQLADTEANLQQTQANLQQAKSDMESDLNSARTQLGGDIARNHAELVVLEKKGERNYFEFSIEKSKAYHHTGPISIELRKADNKHQYCDLQLLVDDREITRKHVDLYESVSFYPEGYAQPLEVVINHIDKDSAKGYVSVPKFHIKEQTAEAAGSDPAMSASANPPAATEPAPTLNHRTDDSTH